jgi:hypothetical protein
MPRPGDLLAAARLPGSTGTSHASLRLQQIGGRLVSNTSELSIASGVQDREDYDVIASNAVDHDIRYAGNGEKSGSFRATATGMRKSRQSRGRFANSLNNSISGRRAILGDEIVNALELTQRSHRID